MNDDLIELFDNIKIQYQPEFGGEFELCPEIYEFNFPVLENAYSSGVYFLTDDLENIIYIGSTKCLVNRIFQHLNKRLIPFFWVFYIPVLDEQLMRKYERSLINFYSPEYNSKTWGYSKPNQEDEIVVHKLMFSKQPVLQ